MAKDHGRTIQDDRRYEALKKQGMSKQKAARIANNPFWRHSWSHDRVW